MSENTDTQEFATEQELDAALDQLLSAPTDNGQILSLCYRPGFSKRVFPDTIELSIETGVKGDRWFEHSWLRLDDGRPDPRNQVCIVGVRLLDLVWKDRANIAHPGDTIITDMSFPEDVMPVGTRLKVGSSILMISDEFNDACTKWVARYGRASRNWINRPEYAKYRFRGVFCQIIQGGTISMDSKIELL